MVNDKKSPINWQEVLKITNNKPELAKEMIAMLGAELSNTKEEISLLYRSKSYEGLLNSVHKLHGSSCYCGVAKLKALTAKIESDLTHGHREMLDADIPALQNEIDVILHYINSEAIEQL